MFGFVAPLGCWFCGIALPTAQLVPDGGSGRADVRSYCRDVRACTSRWTRAADC